MGKMKHLGEQSIRYVEPPYIIASGSIAGKKEGDGPLGDYFDWVEEDPMCGGNSWEEAEGNLQKKAVEIALEKGGLHARDMNYLIAGDLLDQLIASTFGIMHTLCPIFSRALSVHYVKTTSNTDLWITELPASV